MRRASALAAALAVCACACSGAGSPTGGGSAGVTGATGATSAAAAAAPSGPPTPTGSPPPAPTPSSCAERTLATLDAPARVGQLLMVGVPSSGVGPGTAAALAEVRAGSVLLLGNATAPVEQVREVVDAAAAATAAPPGVAPLVAVDQEGGQVQRLRGPGFSDIPSAARQADLEPAALADAAAGWGGELRTAGITADLAPVADVVPSDVGARNRPVGALRRGYGSDPAVVATRVSAFVSGMSRAGVATSVKHFPGLGAVIGNTDFTAAVVDVTTTRDDPALQAFAAGIAAGAGMVMVSLATYERIDPTQPAVFSPTVVTDLLRGDLGFAGVVVSDDLGAAAAVQDVPPGERATRFLRAGGDLAITADAGVARAMAASVLGDPELLATRVDAAAVRVLRLKESLGLLSC